MKAIRIIGLLVVIAAAFAGGYVYKAIKGGASSAGAGGRKVLYWVDPMHPAYKSDKPGIAPDCGMKLEPVYEDSAPASPAAATQPPGTIQISPEKQQMIGVKYGTAEYMATSESLRAV